MMVVVKNKTLGNYAFIDSQNLNLGVRNDIKYGKTVKYKGWNLDFTKFYVYLKENLKVKKAFLFIGYMKENKELYKSLKKAGYELVFKPILEVKTKKEVKIKGNVDAELVLHAMIHFEEYQKAVIVSGDGDFHCLVEYLEQKKKLGWVVIPNKYSYSSLLRKYGKFFRYMNDLKPRLELKKYKTRGIISRTEP